MLCYYLYCTTVYHDPFDINNTRHKLPAEDWRAFVQSDVGSHSHMHCTVPGGPVLLRSMETQAAKVFTTFSPRLTSRALLHTRSLATLPTIFPKSSQGSETTCSTLWSYLHPIWWDAHEHEMLMLKSGGSQVSLSSNCGKHPLRASHYLFIVH